MVAHAGAVGITERRLASEKNFDQMCLTMQRLLDELDPKEARS
jgi:hypothetical protein